MRMMNGRDSTESGKLTAPITRDLLGRCCTIDSKELDLDLQVPCGWEKRLDLKSGKVYLQRRASPDATAARGISSTNFQDLNFPPSASKPPTLNLFDDPTMDLKLLPSPSAMYGSSSSSVCTLDKVKSALERAERLAAGEGGGARKRSVSMSVSKSSSTSSSSVRDGGDLDQEEKSTSASFAAGCLGCLLYVLVSRSNPRCPRCNCNIPMPEAVKKPRIDLNMSI